MTTAEMLRLFTGRIEQEREMSGDEVEIVVANPGLRSEAIVAFPFEGKRRLMKVQIVDFGVCDDFSTLRL
jgi:hypothetical protein